MIPLNRHIIAAIVGLALAGCSSSSGSPRSNLASDDGPGHRDTRPAGDGVFYYGGNGASRDTPTEPRPLGLPRPTPGTPLRQFAAMPRFKPHAPHVRNNESACVGAGIVQPTRFIRPRQPVGSGACHIEQPFMMHAAADGDVRFEPAATLRCQMVPSIETWVDKVLRPAARRYFGSDIARLKIAASYSCRTRNSQFGASLSEHGKGNAIDISMFYLENGEVISVKSGWHGSEAERRFLRYVHRGACEHFSTVLGPNADRYHHDHFHLDLARHGRRGDYRVCR